MFITLNVFVKYTMAYTSVLQPLCGKTDALNYKGQKDYGHFQPCTDELIMAKDVKYYATAPPDASGKHIGQIVVKSFLLKHWCYQV